MDKLVSRMHIQKNKSVVNGVKEGQEMSGAVEGSTEQIKRLL